MKTIKRIVLGVLALILLAVVGMAILISTLDANLLKPVLHKVAREQGIELSIPGDIGWQFYPNLGLTLGVVRISTLDEQPLASITGAALSVRLMPLIQDRAILINGVMLNGLDAQFNIDQEGNTPWSQVGPQNTTDAIEEPAPQPDGEQPLPTLEIDSVEITHLSVYYNNAQTGDQIEITDTHLSSQNVSLTGEPFALSFRSNIKYNEQPAALVEWQGPVALDLEAQTFSTGGAHLTVQLNQANAELDLANITHWGEPFSSAGSLTLQPMELPPLFEALDIPPPDVSNPSVLQQVSVQLNYAVDEQQVRITDATLQLDRIRLQGDLSIADFEQPQIKTRWEGNTILLDDYLPPSATEEQEPQEQTPPTPLPIEALQALNLEAAISFESIELKGLNINQPQVRITAKDGLVTLEKMAMNVADGSVTGEASLDARQPEAELAVRLKSENVELGKLLKALADIDQLSGGASASIEAISRGTTDQALIDNLKLEAVAESQSLRLTPFNMEQQFCRALALVQQESPKAYDWPALTKLEPVTMQLKLSEQTLKLDQLTAEIASLVGAAEGQFNLASGDFNIPFSLSLGDFATTIPGCLPIQEKWRKRALPIRCKGNLADMGPTTCLPDAKLIGDIIKNRVKTETKEKIEQERAELKQKAEQKQDQVEQKLEDKTREAIGKELGDEQTKELEGKVKGALDRFKGKEPAAK